MIHYKYPDARLIVFAKAPQAGYCKTRLIPEIGEQGAAHLQAELIHNCLSRLCHEPLCPTELWCSPDTRHPFFKTMANNFPVSLHQQQGTDLGEKMYHAMSYRDSTYTIIIGTDCPEITSEYIESGITQLSEAQGAVIGPAEDGGYVLLGLRHIAENLFQDISWGTEHVFAQTVQKMKASELIWHELETLWDLDDSQDLVRYQRLKMAQIVADA